MKNKKVLIVSSLIGAALVVSGALLYYFVIGRSSQPNTTSNDQSSGINYSKPTDPQISEGNNIKKQNVDNSTATSGKSSNGTSTQSSSFSTQLTAATVSSNTLYIRNTISGIHQEGSCVLTLSMGTSTVQKTSGVQALPQSSTCKGFDVATSQLQHGTWQITIKVTIGNSSATATGSVKV